MGLLGFLKGDNDEPRPRGRPATEKQLAYIRKFGVEPKPGITIGEASQLLDRLTTDPAALERKSQIEMQQLWELQEHREHTPAPKGVVDKAKKLLQQWRETQAKLPELERRLAEIMQKGAPQDSYEREELQSNFEERTQDIKDTLESAIDDVGCARSNWKDEEDRTERRVLAHELAEFIETYEADADKAEADLANLLVWSGDLLKQIAAATAQAADAPTEAPVTTGSAEQRKRPARRVLTRAQAQSEAGQLLLRAVSHFTEDRKLTLDEVGELRAIISDPALSAGVGVQELSHQLDGVLAKGTIATDDHYGLVYAVKQILPKEARAEWASRMQGPDRPATEAQLNYIEILGGRPRDGLTLGEASEMIDSLLEEKARRQGY